MKWLEVLLITFIGSDIRCVLSQNDGTKEESGSQNLPPCRACKTLVGSFQFGLATTSRGKFEGGDAAWEAEKMGSYATSEVRLVEILESICKEVTKGKAQCQVLAEENEALFEEWWKNQAQLGDLQKWLCIEKLQVCCPDLHYGKNCTPCDGYPDNVCNNNGKCKGSGTRKGNGQCSCQIGYEGTTCDKCVDSYYTSYKDENKLLCSPCHHSCQSTCSQAGPKGCIACKQGWYMDTEHGCLDVNECITKSNPCKSYEFCVNNEGSYTCIPCDISCKTCDGDGPDMCHECADGYHLKGKVCINTERANREYQITKTRYVTYFGLCLATCIIFQKNPYIASALGLTVALYISVSEYTLSMEKTKKYI